MAVELSSEAATGAATEALRERNSLSGGVRRARVG